MKGCVLLGLVGALLVPGCDPQGEGGASLKELRAAPTSVVIDGQRLELKGYLWRDFMPPSPTDGKPLIAIATVKATDGKAVPERIRASRVWVVFGEKVWSSPVKEERPRDQGSNQAVVRGGPKWGPGVEVDLVVRLTDGKREWQLRAPKQRVERTD